MDVSDSCRRVMGDLQMGRGGQKEWVLARRSQERETYLTIVEGFIGDIGMSGSLMVR